MSRRPIRLLTFSTLFPNAESPNHGVFVANRLQHLVASGEAVSTVVAPIAYFPSKSRRFGEWSRVARVPAVEHRHGLTVHHPRFPVIPRFGMSAAPFLLYWASLRAIKRLRAEGVQFDAIDAHYVYPDGVAAIWLGRALGCPVVVTARGSDVSLLPRYAIPRRLIRRAITQANALVGVSAAIRAALIELGADPAKVQVLRNGVDTALFKPTDRAASRGALGFTRPTLLSVGHLIERKGHHRAIEAMTLLPDHQLAIVGEGPERKSLAALIERLDLADRVALLGTRPHADLPALYGAADALVLASSREGWANVLLEAMACGTPVVASNIWGNPEVVQTRDAGLITLANSPAGIADAVRDLFAALPDRRATRAYAERFSWDETTAGQLALFRRVIDAGGAARASPRPLG